MYGARVSLGGTENLSEVDELRKMGQKAWRRADGGDGVIVERLDHGEREDTKIWAR